MCEFLKNGLEYVVPQCNKEAVTIRVADSGLLSHRVCAIVNVAVLMTLHLIQKLENVRASLSLDDSLKAYLVSI